MTDYDPDSWSIVSGGIFDDERSFSDDEGFTKVESERKKTISNKPAAVPEQDTPDMKQGRQAKRLKMRNGRTPSLHQWENEEPKIPYTTRSNKEPTLPSAMEWEQEPTPPQNIPKRANPTFEAQPSEKTYNSTTPAIVSSSGQTRRSKTKQSGILQFVPAKVEGGQAGNSKYSNLLDNYFKRSPRNQPQSSSPRLVPATDDIHHSVSIESQKNAGTRATNAPARTRGISTIARGLDKIRLVEQIAAQTTVSGTTGTQSFTPSNPTYSSTLVMPGPAKPSIQKSTGSPSWPMEGSSNSNCPYAHASGNYSCPHISKQSTAAFAPNVAPSRPPM
ncbi:hypothetical protein BKA61DRAFT_596391 [Leptodontidium sp. MPI-SDFR-AT-0119]|nr:hypothetical protein BKA61DRAFT_596391 [Leptodontidium sp. MPI-SDFR-AT-0119]